MMTFSYPDSGGALFKNRSRHRFTWISALLSCAAVGMLGACSDESNVAVEGGQGDAAGTDSADDAGDVARFDSTDGGIDASIESGADARGDKIDVAVADTKVEDDAIDGEDAQDDVVRGDDGAIDADVVIEPDVPEDARDAPDAACDPTCLGECIAGRCLIALAKGLHNPYNIAVNADHIYFTETNTLPTKLSRLSRNGGTPEVLYNAGPATHSIVLDQANVYWTEFSNPGAVRTMPLAGGVVRTLADAQVSPHGLGVDKTHVYWTNYQVQGTVVRAPIGGGPIETLAEKQGNPNRLAVDDKYVYWSNSVPTSGSIMKAAIDGSSGPLVVAADQDWPYGVVVDKTNIYWTALHSHQVIKMPLDGSGPPVVLAAGQGVAEGVLPWGLAVDDTYVYWINYDNGAPMGQLRKVPIAGGPWIELASDAESFDLVVDATSIYFTKYVNNLPDDGGDAPDPGPGILYRLTPK